MDLPGTPTLTSQRVILRGVQEEDRAAMTAAHSTEFLRMVGADKGEIDDAGLAARQTAFDEACRNPLHWSITVNRQCIGSTFLHSLDTNAQKARYAIGIWDAAYWGKGLGRETTQLILAYAFEQLHLHRLDLRVLAYNTRAIRCYKKCGFREEGRERESAFVNGQWHDDLIMGILSQEFDPSHN